MMWICSHSLECKRKYENCYHREPHETIIISTGWNVCADGECGYDSRIICVPYIGEFIEEDEFKC